LAKTRADHGFVRASDETITTFDPPQSGSTQAVSIDAKGSATGYYFLNQYYGFVRAAKNLRAGIAN